MSIEFKNKETEQTFNKAVENGIREREAVEKARAIIVKVEQEEEYQYRLRQQDKQLAQRRKEVEEQTKKARNNYLIRNGMHPL